jgi:FG-GAP-like repeat
MNSSFASICVLLFAVPVANSQLSHSLFGAAVPYSSAGQWAESVAVGDLNADGKPDLVVANYCAANLGNHCANGAEGMVSILLGNGDGTFQNAITYGSGGLYGESVAIADVNSDGHPDLIVTNRCSIASDCANPVSGPGVVSVLLGNGDGTFQSALAFSSGGNGPSSAAVADVNRDGKLDLLVANANNSVGVLLGNGDGTFQTAVTYGTGAQSAESVGAADLNGDGNPDLIVASRCARGSNCDNGVISVLLGNGNGTFRRAVTYSSGGQSAYSVAVTDVNNDGKPDVLVANVCAAASNCASAGLQPGSVAVLLGNGDGTLAPAVAYGSGGDGSSSVAVGDVNGDGKPDLVVANQCSASSNCGASGLHPGSVAVLFGNGDGTFQTARPFGSGGRYAEAVALADVNGDGQPDLLVANYCISSSCPDGAVGVLLNSSLSHDTFYSFAAKSRP